MCVLAGCATSEADLGRPERAYTHPRYAEAEFDPTGGLARRRREDPSGEGVVCTGESSHYGGANLDVRPSLGERLVAKGLHAGFWTGVGAATGTAPWLGLGAQGLDAATADESDGAW
jgi:hypothetical protein